MKTASTLTAIALAVITILIVASPAEACKCKVSRPFMQVARANAVVVQVRMVEITVGPERHATFEVVKALKGKAKVKQKLVLRSGSGKDCRKRAQDFEVGADYVFTFQTIPAAPFYMDTCDKNMLVVEGDKAGGRTLEALEAVLKAKTPDHQ